MSARPLRVLVFPRDPNPYQALLYAPLVAQGAQVAYLGDETPSHLLNLVLLPLTLLVYRLRGFRLVHVHWVFPFGIHGTARLPVLRRVSAALYTAFLGAARALRIDVVWTAHNVLPHGRVFPDDVAARRRLVRAAALVIGHTEGARAALVRAVGVAPRAWRTIPHGPLAEAPLPAERPAGAPRRVLFFGAIEPYKGVDDLLAAVARVRASVDLRCRIAGRCADPAQEARLVRAAATLGDGVELRLGFVPDAEIPGLFADVDAMALPYRRVTTSGSGLLALAYGVPLVVPDVEALRELPDAAVLRYDGTVDGLADALEAVATRPRAELHAAGAAGHAFAHAVSWDELARRTAEAYRALPGGRA